MKASKLILGTVQFGLDYGINNTLGKPDLKTVFSILDTAFKNDITVLDSAEAYGNAQEIIGEYHRYSVNRFKVITKFSKKRTDLPSGFTERISQNIKTLFVDRLYSYMFHSFNDFEIYYPAIKDELIRLKKENRIERIGVSIYTNNEFEKVLACEGIDLIQLPFNLFDNNSKRAALIMRAREMGVEIHTRSVFLQGLFFKNTNDLPVKLSVLEPYLNKIRTIAKNYHLALSDVALNYAVQQKNIDYVLIGVDSVSQLHENIKSLENEIPVEAVREIDALRVAETELLNPSNWNA